MIRPGRVALALVDVLTNAYITAAEVFVVVTASVTNLFDEWRDQ